MDINYYKRYEPLFGSWYITRLIGEGSFGKVYEIEKSDFSGTYKAALKAITVPANESELQEASADGMDEASVRSYFGSFVQELVKEFTLMSKLKGHSNIVSYEDHMVIEHTGSIGWDILIRMELLTPLNRYIKESGVTRQDVIRLGIDMCRALELCQKYNIIHRDLKPENIFLSETGDFKLGDFGIARTIEKTTSGLSKKGTYTYMAPEVYKGESYGSTVDIYSLGIVLYRLLNGNRAPFMPPAPAPITYNDRERAWAMRFSGEPLPMPMYAKGRLAEIVLKACSYDPRERYSSPLEMRQALEAILYSQEEGKIIYPGGDYVPVESVHYVKKDEEPYVRPENQNREPDKTVSVYDEVTPPKPVPQTNGKKKKAIILIGAEVACIAALLAVILTSLRPSRQVTTSGQTESAEISEESLSEETVASDTESSEAEEVQTTEAVEETAGTIRIGVYAFPENYRVTIPVGEGGSVSEVASAEQDEYVSIWGSMREDILYCNELRPQVEQNGETLNVELLLGGTLDGDEKPTLQVTVTTGEDGSETASCSLDSAYVDAALADFVEQDCDAVLCLYEEYAQELSAGLAEAGIPVIMAYANCMDDYEDYSFLDQELIYAVDCFWTEQTKYNICVQFAAEQLGADQVWLLSESESDVDQMAESADSYGLGWAGFWGYGTIAETLAESADMYSYYGIWPAAIISDIYISDEGYDLDGVQEILGDYGFDPSAPVILSTSFAGKNTAYTVEPWSEVFVLCEEINWTQPPEEFDSPLISVSEGMQQREWEKGYYVTRGNNAESAYDAYQVLLNALSACTDTVSLPEALSGAFVNDGEAFGGAFYIDKEGRSQYTSIVYYNDGEWYTYTFEL